MHKKKAMERENSQFKFGWYRTLPDGGRMHGNSRWLSAVKVKKGEYNWGVKLQKCQAWGRELTKVNRYNLLKNRRLLTNEREGFGGEKKKVEKRRKSKQRAREGNGDGVKEKDESNGWTGCG